MKRSSLKPVLLFVQYMASRVVDRFTEITCTQYMR